MKLPASETGHSCQWFDQQVSLKEATECGAPATHKVKVQGAFTNALVFVCTDHNAEINRGFASKRKQSSQST